MQHDDVSNMLPVDAYQTSMHNLCRTAKCFHADLSSIYMNQRGTVLCVHILRCRKILAMVEMLHTAGQVHALPLSINKRGLLRDRLVDAQLA
jgi:hypothetical protein